jgi:hypothetical protein
MSRRTAAQAANSGEAFVDRLWGLSPTGAAA